MSSKRAKRRRRQNRQPVPAAPNPGAGSQYPVSGQVITQHFRQEVSSYSGPIPPPEALKQYDELVPGAAARILAVAEAQTHHRIALEKKVVASDVWRSWAGLAAGLVVALACVLGGLFVVHEGHDGAGGTIATATVVGLVGVFVYGTTQRRQERTEKAKLMSGKK